MRGFRLASTVRCLINPVCHIKTNYSFLCWICNFVCVRDYFCSSGRTREEGGLIQSGFGGQRCICPQTGGTSQFLRQKRKKNHFNISRISLERGSYISERNQDKPMLKTLHPRDSDIRLWSDLNSVNSWCDKKLLVVAKSLLVLSQVLRCC